MRYLVSLYLSMGPDDYRFDMGIEFEVRIEGHSQYTESPFKGQYGVVQSDLRMSESSDSGNGFCSTHTTVLILNWIFSGNYKDHLHFSLIK